MPVICQRFYTILADPPWPYEDAGRGFSVMPKNAGQQHHRRVNELGYVGMPLEELRALDVRGLAADDAHLYLWTTNAFMEESHSVARAWGFQPKTIITWVKVKLGKPDNAPEPSMATGYWFRSCTEHCLFAVRGSLRLADRGVPNVILSPRLPHSVKPEVFRRMIEEQSPGPRLELFARREVPGWDRWGNEVVSTVSLGSIEAGHVPIELNGALRPRVLRFGGSEIISAQE